MISETTLLQKVKPIQALVPAAVDGTATNTVVIDRLGYDTAYFFVQWAAALGGGAPSAAVASLKLYKNTASSVSSPAPVEYVALETVLDLMADGSKAYAIDLSGCDRYIFGKIDITYTGGTTPTNIMAMSFVLGDKKVNPPVADTIYGRS